MLEESAEPRRLRNAAMVDLVRDDLELYGVDELEERIELLQAEIGRTEAQLARKKAGREAADALFTLNKD
jgi:uncharacterized small protein (DUF1192 family)